MNKIAELKQARAAAIVKAEAADKAASAQGATAEAIAQAGTDFDAAMAEVGSLDDQIKAEEKRANDEATSAAARRTALTAARQSTGPRTVARSHNPPTGPVIEHVRDRVEGDPRRGFQNAGHFAASVMRASMPGAGLDPLLVPLGAASGMSQTVGADGGFLVPPEFSTMIWDGMNRAPDNLLARTDQYTVEGESLTFNANAETSRATGSRYGGIQGYWISEAATITGSKPTFREVKIEPHQLAVMVYATDKLLRNATALDQYITRAATQEINFLVSDAIINGTGAGKPKGILASASRVAVAKASGQAARTIVSDNINDMWSRMHPKSRANSAWFINVDTEPQLQKLSAAVGTGGIPVYLPPGGLADTPNARLLGRPVIPIEYCPTLGTEGDIILADLGAYCTGVKGGVESAMSIHLKFDTAQTAFRFIFEADGQPWLASPITPYKGTNTLSPFVTLATRA